MFLRSKITLIIYLFVLIFHCDVIFAKNEELREGLSSDYIETTSYASSEGLISSVVNKCVSIISGEFVEGEMDLILIGPEPLTIERSYSPNKRVNLHGYQLPTIRKKAVLGRPECKSWQFNHLITLELQEEHVGAKHVKLGAFSPNGASNHLIHESKFSESFVKKNRCRINLKSLKGITNCTGGMISGRSNVKNSYTTFDLKRKTCDVHSSSGNIRHFVGYPVDSNSENLSFWRFWPKYEKKTNGNKILYPDKELVQAADQSGNTIYSWLKFDWFSDKELHINRSVGDPVIYKFDKFNIADTTYFKGKGCFLSEVLRPDFPHITYEYLRQPRTDQYLIASKNWPDNRFIKVTYYKLGDKAVKGLQHLPISDDLDPRINRVKSLQAPVGTDATPITTYNFYYDLNFKCNHKKDSVNVLSGRTTVLDAYQRKTVFHYNQHHRIKEKIKYTLDGSPYLLEGFVWEDDLSNSAARSVSLPSPNQGNLMGKYVKDRSGVIHTARYFEYDENGNLLIEKLYGDLSGTKKAPLALDEINKKPIDNGVESYSITRTYYPGPLNLLSTKKEDNGKITKYTYKDNTDLVASEFEGDDTGIKRRKFFQYDAYGTLITSILDDGSTEIIDNLTGVTERHIKRLTPRSIAPYGLPEKIEVFYLNFSSGQEVLLNRQICSYSPEGRLIKQDHFDADGHLSHSLSWEYNAHGKVTKETNANKQSLIRAYDDNDNLIKECGDHLDHITTHEYDFSNRLIKTEKKYLDNLTFATNFKYDYIGNLISQIDSYGHETKYQYDDFNRLVNTTNPPVANQDGALTTSTTQIEYDAIDNPILAVDARGNRTQKSYNARGQHTSIINPDSTCERFEYNLDGTLAKKIAPNGTETLFKYDCFKRCVNQKVQTSKGIELSQTSSSYNSFHLISSTDEERLTTFYTYDNAGRLVKQVCGETIQQYEYDSLSRLIKTKQWFGNSKDEYKADCLVYDCLNHIVEERTEDCNGHIYNRMQYVYDGAGRKTQILEDTKAGVAKKTILYGPFDQPIKVIDALQNEMHFNYDYGFINEYHQKVLKAESTDPIGRKTIIIYNTRGDIDSIVHKDSFGKLLSSQKIFYDAVGNKCRVVDDVVIDGKIEKKITTAFTYSSVNQLLSVTEALGYPEEKHLYYQYNALGQLDCVTKSDGVLLLHKYNALGLLVFYGSSDKTIGYKYSYNRRNQPIEVVDIKTNKKTSLKYDTYGRLTNETLANDLSIKYKYDRSNRPIQLTLPDDTGIEYTYDAMNLKGIHRTKKGKRSYFHSYHSHDLNGHVTEMHHAAPFKTQTDYDILKRPVNLTNGIWNQTDTKYDSTSRLVSYKTNDPVGKLSHEFTYDSLNHLIQEKGNIGRNYSCDSLHNRLQLDGEPYKLNRLHQVVKFRNCKYIYDRNGNLCEKRDGNKVTTYNYDALNRLVGATTPNGRVEYTYDAFNRRLSSIEDGKTVRYIYQGQNEIGLVDPNGIILELRLLGTGLEGEIGAAVAIELEQKLYIPVHDFNGHVVCLTDEKGVAVETYRYSTFGEEQIFGSSGEKLLESAINNPWRFSSKRVDKKTGLVFFGRRYYDSGLGKWITQDPAGYIDGPNLYAYLQHAPIGKIDPFGLYSVDTADSGLAYNDSVNTSFNAPYHPLKDALSDSGNEGHVNDIQAGDPYKPVPTEDKRFFRTCRNYRHGDFPLIRGAILFVNGIGNFFKDALESAEQISNSGNGCQVHFFHSVTKGPFADLLRCAMELFFHAETERVLNLRNTLDSIFSRLGSDELMLLECHSEGCIITRNALEGYPEELRQRIIVVGYAPAAYIDSNLAYKVYHYRSSRDFVPHLDFFGAARCKNTTTVLKPHKNAPWFDHSINSPTFDSVKDFHTNRFIKEQCGGTPWVL
ncbi:MAG: hypothetical protein H0W88_09260 [Parachlamydiaceae bacterium]|nr:hypothetical protein [Parachlamydiaceae bacterium]